MLNFILVLLLVLNSSGDPVDPETCAFLPANDPCHFQPPVEHCFDENGHEIFCPPI